MTRRTGARQRLLDPGLEPLLVTGGLYAFTALYYTRKAPFQILSVFVLVAVRMMLYVARRGISRQAVAGWWTLIWSGFSTESIMTF